MTNSKFKIQHSTFPKLPYLDALYARLGGGMKLGLERTEKFMEYLGQPQFEFKSIHVAGTNGKGSVVAILAEILQCHGYKVGRFTSPHLVDFRERMRVNGKMIPEKTIRAYLKKWDDYINGNEISFFEITSGLAFKYFADEKVDFAVVETGLGGRLDSTNVLLPELSIITKIAKDHTRILGATLKKIAGEKAGIIKGGKPLRVMDQSPWVLKELKKYANDKQSDFRISKSDKRIEGFHYSGLRSEFILKPQKNTLRFNLPGRHQLDNLILALESAEDILGEKFDIGLAAEALEKVTWPGRFEKIQDKPTVIYDAGHNLDGLKRVFETVEELFPKKKLTLLLGMLRDKEFKDILKLCEKVSSNIHLCLVDSHRSFSMEDLIKVSAYKKEHIHSSCAEGLKNITGSLSSDAVLLITGSHYISADVYSFFM